MEHVGIQLRQQGRLLWVTVAGFVLGAAGGAAVLHGDARPFAGAGSVIVPVALVAGVIAGVAFVVSTRLHRPGETAPMPRWQAIISNVSAAAVTVAITAVTGLGVLVTGQVLASSLRGLELSTYGGAVLTGVAAAIGARAAFRAGTALSAGDLVSLLSAFLVIGTFFAMITTTDPTWWERNFSQLGIGAGGWAFNGTVIVAGILIATVGSYIGRDLHRILGDGRLRGIALIVVAWTFTGAALAGVGLLPLDRAPVPHLIAAFSAVGLLIVASTLSTFKLPDSPPLLRGMTLAFVVVVAAVAIASFPLHLPMAAVEGITVGLALLWLATYVRVLDILSPGVSTPSTAQRPLSTRL